MGKKKRDTLFFQRVCNFNFRSETFRLCWAVLTCVKSGICNFLYFIEKKHHKLRNLTYTRLKVNVRGNIIIWGIFYGRWLGIYRRGAVASLCHWGVEHLMRKACIDQRWIRSGLLKQEDLDEFVQKIYLCRISNFDGNYKFSDSQGSGICHKSCIVTFGDSLQLSGSAYNGLQRSRINQLAKKCQATLAAARRLRRTKSSVMGLSIWQSILFAAVVFQFFLR